MDFKTHAVYRIVAVDHDTISFIDNKLPMPSIPYRYQYTLEEMLQQPKYNFTENIKPIVLITNPQDSQLVLPDAHYPKIESKKLTHVRTLIFSEADIRSIELYIDNENDATVIVDMINNLDKSESCDAGILCRSKSAYVFSETLVLDVTDQLSVNIDLFIVGIIVVIFQSFIYFKSIGDTKL